MFSSSLYSFSYFVFYLNTLSKPLLGVEQYSKSIINRASSKCLHTNYYKISSSHITKRAKET